MSSLHSQWRPMPSVHSASTHFHFQSSTNSAERTNFVFFFFLFDCEFEIAYYSTDENWNWIWEKKKNWNELPNGAAGLLSRRHWILQQMDSLRIIPQSTFVWWRKCKEINSVRLCSFFNGFSTRSHLRHDHNLLGIAYLRDFKVVFSFHDALIEWQIIGELRSNLNEIGNNNTSVPSQQTILLIENGNLLPFRFYTDLHESVLIWLPVSDCKFYGHLTTPHGSLYRYQSIVMVHRFYQSVNSNLISFLIKCNVSKSSLHSSAQDTRQHRLCAFDFAVRNHETNGLFAVRCTIH